jgi:hypothetical protein
MIFAAESALKASMSKDLWLSIDSGKVKFRPDNALLLTPCP